MCAEYAEVTVGNIHRSISQRREIRKEVLAYSEDPVLQAACVCYSERQTCIQSFSLLSVKGVANQFFIRRPAGHDHSTIQAAG